MQLFARDPQYGEPAGRLMFELVEQLREKSDPLNQACLRLITMDMRPISLAIHSNSCCLICKDDHEEPHHMKLWSPEIDGRPQLKNLPSLGDIARISVSNLLQTLATS